VCLENFQAHGVAEHCSFIGGDVFDSIPQGFDVVLIKHFLDMFDQNEVFTILDGVNKALNVGGQVNILVPVYTENIKDSYTVDYTTRPSSSAAPRLRAGHRSCRRTKDGWKNVDSRSPRQLPRTPPIYHRTPFPYRPSCARRRPPDDQPAGVMLISIHQEKR
jgi:hypothetical protein